MPIRRFAGGLPVVIFTGDFYQFPPVKGLPLWQESRLGKDDEFAGQQIWRRFTNVMNRWDKPQIWNSKILCVERGKVNSLQLTWFCWTPKSFLPMVLSVVSVAKMNSLRQRLNHLVHVTVPMFPGYVSYEAVFCSRPPCGGHFGTTRRRSQHSLPALHAWDTMHDLGKRQYVP